LRSGTVEPDRILDLHGLTLDGAWDAIDRGLEQSIARGDRVVLLITGHHRPGDPPVARGKIRAAVHDWLAASRHAGSIAAVRGAHRRHGGGGSLYLVLRRR
jgi:DNA-nicking Smr family endonuclease